jgi:hypothetical protein
MNSTTRHAATYGPTTDNAREYAARIMAMADIPEDYKTSVSSLLFLAYMRGWSEAVKGEIEYHRNLRAGLEGDAA